MPALPQAVTGATGVAGTGLRMPPAQMPMPEAPDTAGDMARAQAAYEAKKAPVEAAMTAELSPAQDAARKAAGELSQAADKASKVAALPMPENGAKHLDPKQLSEAASIWMTLGALMGLATRQPMTAALGNMTAAMEGVHKADAEQYDRATAEFKTNFDAAMKKAKQQIDETNAILKAKDLSLTAKLNEIRIIEAKYDGPLKGMLADYKTAKELIDSREKTFEHAMKLYDSNLRTIETIRSHREAEAARREAAADRRAMAWQAHLDRIAQLEQKSPLQALSGLLEKGLISGEEFSKARAELLKNPAALAGGKSGAGGASSINSRYAASQTEAIMRQRDHLVTIAGLPTGTTPGTFGDLALLKGDAFGKAIKAMIGQKLTQTQSRFFDQLANGLEIEQARLENSGASTQSIASMRKLTDSRPKANDDQATMALWLAMYKQYMKTSQSGLTMWPNATDEQKKLTAEKVRDVERVIPWSVADVSKYVGGDSKSLSDQFVELLKPDAFVPQVSEPAAAPPAVVRPPGVPEGAKYSPSRNEWWLNGKKVG